MTIDHVPDARLRFEALSRLAHLEVVVPRNSSIDIQSLIQEGQLEDLSRLPSRRNLFFDERATVLAVIKVAVSEHEVREILPSLELTVTTHATDGAPLGSGHAATTSGKHDVRSQTFPGGSVANVITLNQKTYMVFRPVMSLDLPRTRLQRPFIYFSATLTLVASALGTASRREGPVLQSFETLPANVLEPLQFDPALRDANVFLPENRITKVAPKSAPLHSAVKPIRGATKRVCPATPALFIRTKCTSVPDAIVVSVHVETSNAIRGSVFIARATCRIDEADVEDLTNHEWPLETKAGDEFVLLLKVTQPPYRRSDDRQNMATLDISVKAHAQLDQGSRIELETSRQTHIDLSQTWPQPVYTWSARPLSTSSQEVRLSGQFHSRPATSDALPKGAEKATGVTFHFTGPATTTKGSDFTMDVQCINRSSRPRRFALVMAQAGKSTSSAHVPASADETGPVADAFAASSLDSTERSDVLDLNPDARIGPLPPGAIHETSMTFRALTAGVLNLGTLKIVDLDTRQTVDVKELPHVVALEGG